MSGKILVVDDNRAIRERLAELLNKEGYEVTTASSGNEAIDIIRRRNFDLAIVDLVMPEIDGMEVLREIKRVSGDTKVIMITAFATVQSAVEAMKRGASDYISKPFRIEDIRATIRRVLEEARFEKKQHSALDESSYMDAYKIVKALANPIRKEIMMLLDKHGKCRFVDIKQTLKIRDAPKLSFHLRELKSAGLIEQDSERVYFLSEKGMEVVKKFFG